ncbi:MAG: hypothetical protein LUC93_10325 [Planctomycetaceae bacterium]|nr:hypothetical protein [Planctomycetaceae bacterium]
MARLLLILAGLFCAITAGMMIMHRNNPNMEPAGILAESFYYTAIVFAVYHLYNKARRNREGG